MFVVVWMIKVFEIVAPFYTLACRQIARLRGTISPRKPDD